MTSRMKFRMKSLAPPLFVVIVAVVGVVGCKPSEPKRVKVFEKKPDPVLVAQAQSGRLPEDPIFPLVKSRCSVCHTDEYMAQQRLTPEQWKKTVAKMQKFGAPISDEEAAQIVDYLALYFTTELPAAPQRLVALPADALPPAP